MTYGLEVHTFYVLCRMRTLSDWEVGGLKVGLYCAFCLCRKAWVGSLCESGDLTLAKSNQTFWGLTGPIRQRWLPLTSWAQFKAFADKEKRHCLWENTRRGRRYDNLWQPFMSIVSTKNTLLHHFDTSFMKQEGVCYIKHRHDLLNDLVCGPTLGLCLFSALFFQLFFLLKAWCDGLSCVIQLNKEPLDLNQRFSTVELVYHQYNTTHYSIIIWANTVQHTTYEKLRSGIDMRFKWSVITVHPAH